MSQRTPLSLGCLRLPPLPPTPARQSPGVGGRRPRAAGSLRWPWPGRQLPRLSLTEGPVTRVRRRGRCGGPARSPGGGGRVRIPAAALSPSLARTSRRPERPLEAPPRPGHPGARLWPAAPRPALRYLGAPERAGPGPAAAPHFPPALAPGPVAAQGRMAGGARGGGEQSGPGGW